MQNAPRGAFCNTFDLLSLRSLFCLFLSGRFTQVLLYTIAFNQNHHFDLVLIAYVYSKTCVKQPLLKRLKIGLHYQLLLNAGQKYCRMLPSRSILQYFRPSLSYQSLLRSLFCLFLSDCFTQFYWTPLLLTKFIWISSWDVDIYCICVVILQELPDLGLLCKSVIRRLYEVKG